MISIPNGTRFRIQLSVWIDVISKYYADRDGTAHTLSGFRYEHKLYANYIEQLRLVRAGSFGYA